DPSKKIDVRWHYGIKSGGTSWSATISGFGSQILGARITIEPQHAANEVGTNHVLTIHVTKQSGANPAFVDAPNADVTASIKNGPGSFVGPNTCTTNGVGTCDVT